MGKIVPLMVLMALSVFFIKAQNVSQVESSIAKALIQTNAEAGISADLLSNSKPVSSYEDAATGIRYIGLQQTFKGIPVYNQSKVLSFRNGKLLSNFGYLDPNMEKAINVASGIPSVTAESAVQSALSDRGFRATQMAIAINRKDEGRYIEFNDMGISREKITARLTWVPDEATKTYKLAWLVYIVPKTTSDYWMVRVNAVNNSILGIDNYTDYDHWGTLDYGTTVRYPGFEYGLAVSNSTNTGLKNFFDFKKADGPSLVTTATYRVVPYPAESPLHPGGAPALRTDPWNAPAVVSNAITLKWHTRSAAQDHMITRGNNVWAYHDRTGVNMGDSVRSATSQTALPNLSFDFVPDFAQEPTVTAPPNQQWNITNLFYWNNIVHDILYGYGFTEAGRNFQDDNLGRGGLGADYVNAEAQDGSGTNGANFSTPPDGSAPRMQMFLWTTATPNRDGDVDNGIIVHEYGHGVSNRSHSVGVSCLNNAEQAGEGWSDYLGLMLTQNWATSTVSTGFNSPRGIGTYVLNQPNNGPGFRPQRYCTDFAVNNATYATLPGQAIPHGVGWVFCSALWELTWELINDPSTTGIDPNIYNFASTGGNVVALRLVMEGLRTQQCQPGFISARNAIMRADTTLYGASHACAIWRAFARRGMGFGAAEGSTSSITDQTVSFTNNPACVTTAPNVTINQAAAQPDPTSVSPINFTVVFDQAVTGFTTGDVTLTGTAGATLGTVTGSGTTYNVAVSGMTSSGTVTATIAAGVCQNAAAQTNNASTSTDNTVTFNFTANCTSVNAVTNQTVCHNSPTAAVNFTSPTPGTTFSWVNNTPSIGLAASGSGNIPGFTATNPGTAPVTANITVTPTLTTVTATTTTFNFTGGAQTFTVPAGVTSINLTALGVQGGAGASGGNGANGGSGGLGSRATGTLAVTPGQVLTIFVGGQGGTPTSGFNGGGTGGNANSGGGGGATDIRFPGADPTDRIIVAGGGGGGGRAGCEPNTVNGGAGGAGDGNGANGANSPNGGGGFGAVGTTPGAAGVGCAGFLGSPGLVGVGPSGGSGGAGQTCCCFNFASVPGGGGGGGGFPGGAGGGGGSAGTTGCIGSDKGGGGGGAGGTSSTSGVTAGVITPGINSGNGQVVLNYNVTTVCTGPTTGFTITVNPAPNAVATPTTQTICSGISITPIVLSGAVSGTTYTWARNNTANITGIANSGTGSPISGTPINNTTVQQTATYTISPTANGCVGPTITATLIVDKEPTITCPANIIVNNTPNMCGTNVAFPPVTATGSPSPVIIYSQASGSFFPVGTTTVTATATNSCGLATCTFTITVLDVQNPTITCPAPVTQNTDNGVCSATVVTPNPVIADNCAVTVLTWTITGATTASSPATGINFAGTRAFNLNGTTGTGISTVTYVARDAAGNTSTCSFTVTVIGSQLPVITVQPTNKTVCAGSAAIINVAVSNAVSYQWQVSTNGGSGWNSIAGATTPTLTLSAVTLSMNANLYRVIINGPCTNIISDAASLQVNPLPLITIAAAPAPVLIPGKSTTITANVSPAGGSFAWTFNGSPLAGASASSIGPLTVDNLGTYYANYTNLNGCVARSNEIVVSGTVSCCIYVYPNPNRGQFHVRFYNQPLEDITVRIFDLKGVLIYAQTIKGNATPYTDFQVNLNNYIRSGGTYMVEVRGKNGVLVGSEQVIIH